MEPERIVDLLFNLAIIPIAAVVNYYVMRRIIRQDVKNLILNRIFEGPEIKDIKGLVGRLNEILDSDDIAEAKKQILRILGEL